MSNVVPLTGHHMSIGDTPDSVKIMLLSLVEKANRGELLGLAAAWVEGGNDVGFQIAQGAASSPHLVAAVSTLQYEINRRWSGK